MKKVFKLLMLALVSSFALASCEDVPMPYEKPNGSGGTETPGEDVVVEPAGTGTLADPYNVAAIVALINEMESGAESTQAYYIKGKVKSNSTTESTISQYGNMSFDMIDEGNTSTVFKAFQVYGPGNKKFTSVDQIKEGDEVVVYGKVVNYQGNTPETVGKGAAYVYSINSSSEPGTDPVTPVEGIEVTCAKAAEIANAMADNATSEETYAITGYITDVYATVSKGQQSFWMADTQDGGKVIQAYWANLPEGVEAFTKGSKVKITGQIIKYVKAADGTVTPEVKNADVEILEAGDGGNTGGNTDQPNAGDAKHITIAEFLSKADTETTYELTGIVKNIVNTTYGNFDLVEGEASIYIYGLLDKDGNAKNFASLGISEGDELTLTGVYVEYNGKAEIKNAQFISVKKGDNGGNTGGNENTGGESTSSLSNGDFESWVSDSEPTGWKSASTASSATLSKSTDAHGGQYAVCVAGNASQNKRLASKEITLEAGTYKFAFYAKATSANAAQVRPGYVPITDGKVGNYTYGDYTTISTNWTLVEYEFTLTAQTTVCLVVMNPKASSYSSGEDALIDDATLTKK